MARCAPVASQSLRSRSGSPGPRVANVQGQLCGDRGALSQALLATLFAQGVPLIPKLRQDLKNQLLPMRDTLVLPTRSVIATGNAPLKPSSQSEPSRHRRVPTCLVTLVAGLIAYPSQPQHPSRQIRLPQDPSTSRLVLALHRPQVWISSSTV